MWLFAILACTNTNSNEALVKDTKTSVSPKTGVVEQKDPQTKDSSDIATKDSTMTKRAKEPKGSIGGIPILPTPSILGDIDNEAVVSLMKAKDTDFQACLDAETRKSKPYGKLSVYFTTDKGGSVTRSTVRSSTLRHKATEACVLDIIAKMSFPKLTDGNKAVVIYPLTFGTRPTKP